MNIDQVCHPRMDVKLKCQTPCWVLIAFHSIAHTSAYTVTKTSVRKSYKMEGFFTVTFSHNNDVCFTPWLSMTCGSSFWWHPIPCLTEGANFLKEYVRRLFCFVIWGGRGGGGWVRSFVVSRLECYGKGHCFKWWAPFHSVTFLGSVSLSDNRIEIIFHVTY